MIYNTPKASPQYIRQLQERLVGQVVEFAYPEGDLTFDDTYLESGMRGKVVHISTTCDGEVIELKIDYRGFEAHNKKFEGNSYYIPGNDRLGTAREAGVYRDVEELFLPGDWVADVVKVINTPETEGTIKVTAAQRDALITLSKLAPPTLHTKHGPVTMEELAALLS